MASTIEVLLLAQLNAIQNSAWTTTYVPTWTQSGQTPAIGNGTIATGYMKIGHTVFGRYQYNFGSTSNFGSGGNAWNWTVPVTAVTPALNFWNVGAWSALCAGVFYSGSVRLESTGILGLFANNSTFSVNTTNPATWNSSSYLQMSFQYESTS